MALHEPQGGKHAKEQVLTYQSIGTQEAGYLSNLLSIDLHRLQFSPSQRFRHTDSLTEAGSYGTPRTRPARSSAGLPLSPVGSSWERPDTRQGVPGSPWGDALNGLNTPGQDAAAHQPSRSAPASRGSHYLGRLNDLCADTKHAVAISRPGTTPVMSSKTPVHLRGTALSRAALERVHRAERTLVRLQTPGAPIDSRPPSGQTAQLSMSACTTDQPHNLAPPASTKMWSKHLGGMMTGVASRRAAHRATASAWAAQLADAAADENSLVGAAQRRAQALLCKNNQKRKPHKHHTPHTVSQSFPPVSEASSAMASPANPHWLAASPAQAASTAAHSPNRKDSWATPVLTPTPHMSAAAHHSMGPEMSAPVVLHQDSGSLVAGTSQVLQPCKSVPCTPATYDAGLRVLHVGTSSWALAAAAGTAGERYGGYAGVYGSVRALRKQLQDQRRAVVVSNPAAFKEDVAARAESTLKDFALQAQKSLQRISSDVTSKKDTYAFYMALEKLRAHRPYYVQAAPPSYQLGPRPATQEASRVWAVEKSVFAVRYRDSPNQDVIDTPQVYDAQFQMDWATAMSSEMISLARDVGLLVEADDDSAEEISQTRTLQDIQHMIKAWQHPINALFNKCCLSQPEQPEHVEQETLPELWRMSETQWLALCKPLATSFFHQLNSSSNWQDACQAIFKDCCAPDVPPPDDQDDWSDNSSDRSTSDSLERQQHQGLSRPRFLACLLRLSFTVIRGSEDAAAALQGFMQKVVASAVPAGLLPDHLNAFRQRQLYCETCDRVVQQHWSLLMGMWRLYKAKDGAKTMQLHHWRNLMSSLGINSIGIPTETADHAFVLSRMVVIDEESQPARAYGLAFIDFVEGIARISDKCNLPATQEGINQANGNQLAITGELQSDVKENQGIALPRSGADGEGSTASRPLAERLAAFLSHAANTLQELWGGANIHDCGAKMCRMAAILAGGADMA